MLSFILIVTILSSLSIYTINAFVPLHHSNHYYYYQQQCQQPTTGIIQCHYLSCRKPFQNYKSFNQRFYPTTRTTTTISHYTTTTKTTTSLTAAAAFDLSTEVVIGGSIIMIAAFFWFYIESSPSRALQRQRQKEEELYQQYQEQRQQLAYIEPKDYWTVEELKYYDGTNDNEEGPILLAADGVVYNVSKGRNFYGPGGEYHIFAGRDATRLLARTLVEEENEEDSQKPLTMAERAALAGWMWTFQNKYDVVGKLQGFDPSTTSMKMK